MPPEKRDVDPLRELSEQISSGNPPSSMEIEHALEVGFGHMMGLEAEFARACKRAAADPGAAGEVDELRERIEVLREALVEVRTACSPPGPPRIGYGFVLPGQDPAGHPGVGHRTPRRSERS